MIKILATALVILTVCIFSVAQATTYTYVGSYAVLYGPDWVDNPPVYSAVEAAALIFGGLPSDYAISINSSQNPMTITFTGWYDGWGDHNGNIFAQNYKLDLGEPGYAYPEENGAAYSAYVHDGLFDTNYYRNYVWRSEGTPVPLPPTLLLLAPGLIGLAGLKRKYLG
jgi:hypothetical protein